MNTRMNNRADIEAAFVEAEAELARVVTILAKANADPARIESDLPRAFSDLAKAKADVTKAEEDLAKARASCIAARDRLARLNFEEGKPKIYLSELRHATHEAASGNVHSNRRKAHDDRRRAHAGVSRAHATGKMAGTDRRNANQDRRYSRSTVAKLDCAQVAVEFNGSADTLMKGASIAAKPGATANLSDPGASPGLRRETSRRNTPAWQTLAWQAMQLLLLTLAYLQYYWFDVNLQIAMLPSPVLLLGLLAS